VYLRIWLRQAGLVTLGLVGVLFCALVLAGFGSHAAAAQEDMAAWMYMPAYAAAASETLHLVPARAAGDAALTLTPVDNPASVPSGPDAGMTALPGVTSGGSFERYLRPTHSATASRSIVSLGGAGRTRG
jgi:hypothetical protein